MIEPDLFMLRINTYSLFRENLCSLKNYPNPFNPTTKIVYSIKKTDFVDLRVFDILGREIMTLVEEVKQPGKYTVYY